jgi:hypothetical protein
MPAAKQGKVVVNNIHKDCKMLTNQFHIQLTLTLSIIYPHHSHQFAFLVNLSLVKITETCCNMCNYPTPCNDLVDHVIMHCQCNKLVELRNTSMESVLEVFSVERSVEFCNQDEGLDSGGPPRRYIEYVSNDRK